MPADPLAPVQPRQRVAVDIVARGPDDGRAAGPVLASGWLLHGETPNAALARIMAAAGLSGGRAEAVAAAIDLGGVTSEVHDLASGVRVHRLGLVFPLADALVVEELARSTDAAPTADLEEVPAADESDGRQFRSPHAGHQPGDGPVRIQRAACYAVVREPGRVLLTRLRRIGLWALPGGGIDIGEHPDDALTREVFEESGFRLSDVRMAGVGTAHWTGRAPHGVLEDFQAVNLLYTGTAPLGRAPRVVELDGSTEEVAWIDENALADLRLTTATVTGLALVGVRPG